MHHFFGGSSRGSDKPVTPLAGFDERHQPLRLGRHLLGLPVLLLEAFMAVGILLTGADLRLTRWILAGSPGLQPPTAIALITHLGG